MSLSRAVHFVLTREDPTGKCVVTVDSGGVTCVGIALARHPELTEADVRSMTWERAGLIYAGAQYWGAIRGDDLPGYLQTPMLDACVNQGPGMAVRCLQEALYVAPADGILGPQTLTALGRAPVSSTVLTRYAARRIVHYSRDPTWGTDASGWCERAIAASMDAYV